MAINTIYWNTESHSDVNFPSSSLHSMHKSSAEYPNHSHRRKYEFQFARPIISDRICQIACKSDCLNHSDLYAENDVMRFVIQLRINSRGEVEDDDGSDSRYLANNEFNELKTNLLNHFHDSYSITQAESSITCYNE